jgi:hypothetical protein
MNRGPFARRIGALEETVEGWPIPFDAKELALAKAGLKAMVRGRKPGSRQSAALQRWCERPRAAGEPNLFADLTLDELRVLAGPEDEFDTEDE